MLLEKWKRSVERKDPAKYRKKTNYFCIMHNNSFDEESRAAWLILENCRSEHRRPATIAYSRRVEIKKFMTVQE